VTFTKHIAPILQRGCQNCHRPDSVALTGGDFLLRRIGSAVDLRKETRRLPGLEVSTVLERQSNQPIVSTLTGEFVATALSTT
jgi:hypothetical protein